MPTDPEVPEADALEQSQSVAPEEDEPELPIVATGAFEVSEADALVVGRGHHLTDLYL